MGWEKKEDTQCFNLNVIHIFTIKMYNFIIEFSELKKSVTSKKLLGNPSSPHLLQVQSN